MYRDSTQKKTARFFVKSAHYPRHDPNCVTDASIWKQLTAL